MLNNYFQHQAHIFDIECNFRCPDDCNAPGCRKADIIVEVTLFDLIRLGRFLNTPVSHLFSQYCHLGLMIYENNIRYKKLLIKMKKPCLFLSRNECVVHNAKPLNCKLFPESYHIKGLLPKLSKNPLFYTFPCLKKPIVISEKRKTALKKLRRMSLLEQALSHAYLFGVPNFIIDEKPLRKKLRRSHPKHRNLSLQDYDKLLNKLLKSYSFIESVMEKISRLDAESEIKNLFEKLSDRVMMEHLMEKMVRPVVVHRLERDDIKQLKRRLHPPAICFM
jgi:Fe-S-cluster containining protein